jgi:hypothetical protein
LGHHQKVLNHTGTNTVARLDRRPHHCRMQQLPVHTGADVHLADAFSRPGCPLCRERVRQERAYLESVLAESVLDVGFRTRLDTARGFCAAHSRALLGHERRGSGSLGASILLRATLAVRLRELEEVHADAGRGRGGKATRAARQPACPACERVRGADHALAEGLVALCADPAWAGAAADAPLCLDHLVMLMDRRSAPAWWLPVERRQLERLRDLRDRLDGFAHASAHDRRHLQTDALRASVDEAADLLGGRQPPDTAGTI